MATVEKAFAKVRGVWESQNAGRETGNPPLRRAARVQRHATMQDDASGCLGRQSRGASLVHPRTTRRHELAAPLG